MPRPIREHHLADRQLLLRPGRTCAGPLTRHLHLLTATRMGCDCTHAVRGTEWTGPRTLSLWTAAAARAASQSARDDCSFEAHAALPAPSGRGSELGAAAIASARTLTPSAPSGISAATAKLPASAPSETIAP